MRKRRKKMDLSSKTKPTHCFWDVLVFGPIRKNVVKLFVDNPSHGLPYSVLWGTYELQKKMDLSSKTSSIHYFWASSTSFVSRFHSEWFHEKKSSSWKSEWVHYARDTRFESRNLNWLFIPFFVFGLWSLLATKLRKYENIL